MNDDHEDTGEWVYELEDEDYTSRLAAVAATIASGIRASGNTMTPAALALMAIEDAKAILEAVEDE